MAHDFHNPDETAYDLISRLRKEAKGKKTGYKKINFVPHPSVRRSGKGKLQSASLFKFRKFIRIPMDIMGIKLSTVLMGVSTLLALAIISIGLTIFFTHTPAGSPVDPYNNPNEDFGSGYVPETDNENSDDTDAYGYYEYQDEQYADDDDGNDEEPDDELDEAPEEESEENPDDEEENSSNDYALPPSHQEIAVAIRPHIAGLRSQLNLTFDAQEWASIIEELASQSHDAYHNLESGTEDWLAFVVEYAQTIFLESDWVMDIGLAPMDEDSEDDEDNETEATTPTPSPIPTPSPTPTPNDPETDETANNGSADELVNDVPHIVFVTLTAEQAGQSTNIVLPMIYNQTLIDLFIRDFYLRLAVNDPSRFPFNENGMTAWANTIVSLYFNEGQAGAEYRLRRNIAALERADIQQQYVPWVPGE